jgi:hypothetical protein
MNTDMEEREKLDRPREGSPGQNSDRTDLPENPIIVEYEAPHQKAYREVVVPKWLCRISYALLWGDILGILYGVILLIVGHCFRVAGIKFKPTWQPPRRRRF